MRINLDNFNASEFETCSGCPFEELCGTDPCLWIRTGHILGHGRPDNQITPLAIYERELDKIRGTYWKQEDLIEHEWLCPVEDAAIAPPSFDGQFWHQSCRCGWESCHDDNGVTPYEEPYLSEYSKGAYDDMVENWNDPIYN